jgi:hypothetical protein
VTRVTGSDGKTYPIRPLGGDELEFLIGRAHYLSHDEHLSIRQIVRRLESDDGPAARRSVGTISAWLAQPCVRCFQVSQNHPPEHLPAEATA